RGTVDALAGAEDPVLMQRHALAFWDQVVDGADSVVFRLMFNSLRATYEPALEAFAHVMEPEVTQVAAYRRLVTAITGRDSWAARDAATDLLAPTTATLLDALTELEKI
ncbi:MAG: FCD domain-containing protein, partial [Oryzihumus sp.]